MKALLMCSCFNQQKDAIKAYLEMFPNTDIPEVIKGRDRIYKLSQQLKNEHIKAISKLTGRYSYYLDIDENGIIKEEYDLINHRRIA